MVELVILSIVQGITEFLPISSSAHLIIISNYFNFSNKTLTLDISLHLGSLLAIIFYFRIKFLNFIKNKELFKKIILASIPVSILGFLLIKTNYINIFRTYSVIGWSTIVFGLILLLSDLKKTNKNITKNFNYKDAIIVGFFQSLSLISGASRSGVTITGARMIKYSRVDAAKISFLTSIPVLILASLYNMQKIIMESQINISIVNIAGILFSFIFSFLTIKFFLKFLKKFSLRIFVIYRLILCIIILLYVYK